MSLRMKLLLMLALFALCGTVVAWEDTPTSRFDRLTEEDRVEFSKRFEKEVWPLFLRNEGDGCVGCHTTRQNRGGLSFTGKADPDFRTLLKKGFFLPKDPGGVLYVVNTKDTRRRMPPGNRDQWTAKEVELLKSFVTDLDKKQK